jgi:cobaltochelatase CobN
VIHNQDNREHDLLDSDDYYQFEGGLAAAVETLSGRAPRAVARRPFAARAAAPARASRGDRAHRPRPRDQPALDRGCRRHGYKGAFEMAATVDYLFAFAATTDAVRDHHFAALHDAYLGDAGTRDFLAEANPAALREMAGRFIEALDRGLWRSGSNALRASLTQLAAHTTEITA